MLSSKTDKGGSSASAATSSAAKADNTLTNLPLKLHALLEEAEYQGKQDVVSWESNGTAFKVHDKNRFVAEVMPKYFSTSNYQSFQRNCNLWGFRTASKGPAKGQCSHANFIRGNLDACRTMKVVRNKTFPEQATSSSLNTGAISAAQAPLIINNHTMAISGMENTTGMSTPGDGLDLSKISQLLSQPGIGIQPVPMNSYASADSSNAPMLSTLLSLVSRENNGTNVVPPPQQQQPLVQTLAALLPCLNNGTQLHPQQQSSNQFSDLVALLGGHNAPQQQQQKPQWPATSTLLGSSMTETNRSSSSDCDSSMSNGKLKMHAGDVDIDSLVLKARMLREAALHRGSRVIACRARGMPMDHSSNTAFFEITADTKHGNDLICSHPMCHQGGIKFVFCKYCDAPVAKRSFRSHHDHEVPKDSEAKGITAKKRNAQNVDGSVNQEPLSKRKQKSSGRLSVSTSLDAPLAALAAAAAAAGMQMNAPSAAQMPQADGDGSRHASIQITSGFSDTSSVSTSTENRHADDIESSYSSGDDNDVDRVVETEPNDHCNNSGRLEAEWLALLDARRRVETANDMSAWLMRVFAVSQHCTGTRNNVSDGETK